MKTQWYFILWSFWLCRTVRAARYMSAPENGRPIDLVGGRASSLQNPFFGQSPPKRTALGKISAKVAKLDLTRLYRESIDQIAKTLLLKLQPEKARNLNVPQKSKTVMLSTGKGNWP